MTSLSIYAAISVTFSVGFAAGAWWVSRAPSRPYTQLQTTIAAGGCTLAAIARLLSYERNWLAGSPYTIWHGDIRFVVVRIQRHHGFVLH
jgi:hypothetical protein